jgi:hypothetical protein
VLKVVVVVGGRWGVRRGVREVRLPVGRASRWLRPLLLLLLVVVMVKAHRLMEEGSRRDDANMWTVVSGLEAIHFQ